MALESHPFFLCICNKVECSLHPHVRVTLDRAAQQLGLAAGEDAERLFWYTLLSWQELIFDMCALGERE